tara:strand:+ start:961 stop:1245 length:285 start_codon:yes stop_codon:yes gene_type:complete
MNILTIPFPAATANVADKEIIIDLEDLVTVQQVNATSTIIYVSTSNYGTITLTHSSAANGSVGNAINNAILGSSPGNTIVLMPTGIAISSVAYN